MNSRKFFLVFSIVFFISAFGVADETFDVNYFEPEGNAFNLPIDSTDEIFINGTGYDETGCDWRFRAWADNGTKVTDEAGNSEDEPCDEILVNPEFPESTGSWPGAYDSPDYYEMEFTIEDENVSMSSETKDLYVDDVDFFGENFNEGDEFYRLSEGEYSIEMFPINDLVISGAVEHNSNGFVNVSLGGSENFKWEYFGATGNSSLTQDEYSFEYDLDDFDSGNIDFEGSFINGYEYDMAIYDTLETLSPRTAEIVEEPIPYNEWTDYLNYDYGDEPSDEEGFGSFKIDEYGSVNETFGLNVRDFGGDCGLYIEVYKEYPGSEELVYSENIDDSDGDNDCSTGMKYISESLKDVFDTALNTEDESIYRIDTYYNDGFNPQLRPSESYYGSHFVSFLENPLNGTSNTNDKIVSDGSGDVDVSFDYQFNGKGSVELIVENQDDGTTYTESMDNKTSMFVPSKDASGNEHPPMETASHTFDLPTGNYSARVETQDLNGNDYSTEDYDFTVSELQDSYVELLEPEDGAEFSYTESENGTNVSMEWEVGAFEQDYDSTIWVDYGQGFEKESSFYIDEGDVSEKGFENEFSEGTYSWKVNATGQSDDSVLESEEYSFTVSEVSDDLDVNYSDVSPQGTVVYEDLEDAGTGTKNLYYNFTVDSSQSGDSTIYLREDGSQDYSPVETVSIDEGKTKVSTSTEVGEGNIDTDYIWKINTSSDTTGDVIESEEYEYVILNQEDVEPEKNDFGKFIDSIVNSMASTFGISFRLGKYLFALLVTIILSSFVAWATSDGGAFTFSMVTGLIFFSLADYFPKTYVVILALVGSFILAFFSRNMVDWDG